MLRWLCLVVQSYPSLCNPVDCSPPGSSVPGDSPGKTTREGRHALSQGIFPTQEPNPGLQRCRWILYHLRLQGRASRVALVVRNPPVNAGAARSPGEGHGNPLQYSCLENLVDRGTWWATAQGVTKSQTQLKRLSMCTHTLTQYTGFR